jgi:fibronectin type 3 domain-containing protein
VAIDESGNESGRSAAVRVTIRGPDLTAPATPENVSVSPDGTDPTRVTVRWNASVRDSDGGALTGLSGYVVLRSRGSGGFAVVDTVGSDVREFEDTGLELLTVYGYTVSAFDEAGNSSSQASSVQVTTGGLPVPGRVAAVGGVGQIVVTWDAASGSELQGYNVYRSDRSDGTYVLLTGAEGGGFTTGRTSYEDADVVVGQVYFYRVEAVGSSGVVSEQSVFVSAEVEADEAPPETPSGLLAFADDTATTITLSWSGSSRDSNGGELTGLASYVVFRSRDNAATLVAIDTLDATLRQLVDTGLVSSTTYFYAVSALDPEGNASPLSATVSATTPGIDVPTGVDAVSGIKRIDVSWNGSTDGGLLGYNVYRSTRSDQGYTRLAGIEGTSFTTGQTTYVDSGLTGGAIFFYRITIVTDEGESGQSAFVGATVGSDIRAPAAPAFVDGEPVTGDPAALSLEWRAPTIDAGGFELTGLSTYRIYRSDSVNGPFTQVGSSETTSFLDEGLDATTTYFYRVEALDDEENVSDRSSSVALTTAGVDVPKNVSLSSTTPSNSGESPVVTISWDASVVTKGAVLRYEVQRTQLTSPEDADFTDVLPTSVATSRTDSGVTRGETYYYRVRMVDSLQRESAWTTPVSVTVSN